MYMRDMHGEFTVGHSNQMRISSMSATFEVAGFSMR